MNEEKFFIGDRVVYYRKELDGGGSDFGIGSLSQETVWNRIRKGKILEMCSGVGFMGFYLMFGGKAESLVLSDINKENEWYIRKTIEENFLEGVKFLHSDSFGSFPKSERFDTIILNPPHFLHSEGVENSDYYHKLRSIDEGMQFHKKFFNEVGERLENDGEIVLIGNDEGITIEDIRGICGNNWSVDLIFKGKFPKRKSIYYTIIITKVL